jgi:hypothetical protein
MSDRSKEIPVSDGGYDESEEPSPQLEPEKSLNLRQPPSTLFSLSDRMLRFRIVG